MGARPDLGLHGGRGGGRPAHRQPGAAGRRRAHGHHTGGLSLSLIAIHYAAKAPTPGKSFGIIFDAMRGHVVVDDVAAGPGVIRAIRGLVKDRHGIEHLTVRVEDEALASEAPLLAV